MSKPVGNKFRFSLRPVKKLLRLIAFKINSLFSFLIFPNPQIPITNISRMYEYVENSDYVN